MPKRTCSPNPGNILTYLRTSARLTLTELSKLSGVNINVLCQFGLRGSSLSIGNLKRLAAFFHVPMDALARNDCSILATLPAFPKGRTDAYRKRLRKNQRKKEKIGDMGEDFVAELERKKLKGTIYEGKVNTAPADDQKSVCDMLSIDLAQNKLLPIEVKSTSGSEDEPIYFSSEELGFLRCCAEDGSPYQLHRVSHVGVPGKTVQTVYTAAEALDAFVFEPSAFVAYRKKT